MLSVMRKGSVIVDDGWSDAMFRSSRLFVLYIHSIDRYRPTASIEISGLHSRLQLALLGSCNRSNLIRVEVRDVFLPPHGSEGAL